MLERCLREGRVLLIENVNEELDSSLDPLMSRQFVKKGKAIKIDGKEVDLHPDFRLIIHSKLANPHFRPELQAQATLLNFTVTRDGLEEQLLAEVVRAERPDLENSRAELVKQENDFKIALKALEDDLLLRLSKAQGAFLADSQLVDSLEQTKATANDITQRAAEAAQTAQAVNEFRELYRPAASRASLLFFIIGDLRQLNPIYQFSLKSFIGVFQR
jgi:dynein heavy chain